VRNQPFRTRRPLFRPPEVQYQPSRTCRLPKSPIDVDRTEVTLKVRSGTESDADRTKKGLIGAVEGGKRQGPHKKGLIGAVEGEKRQGPHKKGLIGAVEGGKLHGPHEIASIGAV